MRVLLCGFRLVLVCSGALWPVSFVSSSFGPVRSNLARLGRFCSFGLGFGDLWPNFERPGPFWSVLVRFPISDYYQIFLYSRKQSL